MLEPRKPALSPFFPSPINWALDRWIYSGWRLVALRVTCTHITIHWRQLKSFWWDGWTRTTVHGWIWRFLACCLFSSTENVSCSAALPLSYTPICWTDRIRTCDPRVKSQLKKLLSISLGRKTCRYVALPLSYSPVLPQIYYKYVICHGERSRTSIQALYFGSTISMGHGHSRRIYHSATPWFIWLWGRIDLNYRHTDLPEKKGCCRFSYTENTFYAVALNQLSYSPICFGLQNVSNHICIVTWRILRYECHFHTRERCRSLSFSLAEKSKSSRLSKYPNLLDGQDSNLRPTGLQPLKVFAVRFQYWNHFIRCSTNWATVQFIFNISCCEGLNRTAVTFVWWNRGNLLLTFFSVSISASCPATRRPRYKLLPIMESNHSLTNAH